MIFHCYVKLPEDIFHLLGKEIPTDFHIFQRGRAQPSTRSFGRGTTGATHFSTFGAPQRQSAELFFAALARYQDGQDAQWMLDEDHDDLSAFFFGVPACSC